MKQKRNVNDRVKPLKYEQFRMVLTQKRQKNYSLRKSRIMIPGLHTSSQTTLFEILASVTAKDSNKVHAIIGC